MSESPKEESKKSSTGDHESRVRVFRYLSILFAAAFLLLLLAFLMQNRTNQEAISDLTESVTTVHNVVEENAALRERNAELEKKLSSASKESVRKKLEISQKLNELDELRRTVDAIPDAVIREYTARKYVHHGRMNQEI